MTGVAASHFTWHLQLRIVIEVTAGVPRISPPSPPPVHPGPSWSLGNPSLVQDQMNEQGGPELDRNWFGVPLLLSLNQNSGCGLDSSDVARSPAYSGPSLPSTHM